MHFGWNLISLLGKTGSAGLQTEILQKMPFSTYQQYFLWFFLLFSRFLFSFLWCLFWIENFTPTSKTLNVMRKKAGEVGIVWVESFKKILNWFLVKLQRTITFALVIRINIILYAFRVEFDFPPCWNLLCWFANSNSPENAIFYILVMFFVIFLHSLRFLFWYLRRLFWLKTFYSHF